MYILSSGNIVHDKVGVNLDANPRTYEVYLSSVSNNSQGNPYQRWTARDMGDDTYRIIHTFSNLALDANYDRKVYLSSLENNGENNPYQRWRFVLISGTYRIIHKQTGLALDANADCKVYLSAPEHNNANNPYQQRGHRASLLRSNAITIAKTSSILTSDKLREARSDIRVENDRLPDQSMYP
ncbi:12630_t:CDS:2 [Ambispora gerdemannii]|uniref:12630_t:CDS:1 n=1 Tax=Ambispora gerdemannii TaxID=144530 RepID=A0A9N9CX43_9GLOM|nr:12630_t:CDS:2 [Ambispora gerdemannii]